MKRLAASVVAFLSFVSIGFAQSAKESPQAMLSLVVTDSRGNHIPSLARSDFQVSIGGTPVDVEKFSERGGGAAGEMRRIAVFFDGTTLSPAARRQAVDAVHGFLARALRPGDMAVILAGG